jgi:hypothetical protein
MTASQQLRTLVGTAHAARLLVTAILGLASVPTGAAGQTHSTVSVLAQLITDTARARVPTICGVQTRVTAGERTLIAATQDTLVLRILGDSAGTIEVGAPENLELFSGGVPVDSVLAGQARRTHSSNVGALIQTPLTIVRRRDSVMVCTATLAKAEPTSGDTIPLHLAHEKQRAIDSLQLQKAVTGQSFIILSLIKSIAGEIPRDEFFDIRLRLGGPAARRQADIRQELQTKKTAADSAEVTLVSIPKVFTTASVDISLSTRASDSLSDTTSGKRLTDASLAINWVVTKDYGAIPDRIGSIMAPWFKVFNTQSYIGVGYNGLELVGSRLEGSTVAVGYLYRYYDDSSRVRTDTTIVTDPGTGGMTTTIRDVFRARTRHSLFLEFFLRVPRAQFLDRIRVRGGVLFPLERGLRPETRIVLSVPIVDLDRF